MKTTTKYRSIPQICIYKKIFIKFWVDCDTYFFPSDIIPYRTPVPNIRPQPKILAKLGSRRMGGIAALKWISTRYWLSKREFKLIANHEFGWHLRTIASRTIEMGLRLNCLGEFLCKINEHTAHWRFHGQHYNTDQYLNDAWQHTRKVPVQENGHKN